MNPRIAFLSDRIAAPDASGSGHRTSAFAAALNAYNFLCRQFGPVLRSLLLPIIAAGLVLYITLSRYLIELVRFLEIPNPRVASLALGTLAAGVFLSLFCYAVAVSAVCDLVLGKAKSRSFFRFKAERQAWRLYAAYLRLLLLLSAVVAVTFIVSSYLAPPPWIPKSFIGGGLSFFCVAGIASLIARVGFLIAPIVTASEGAVVRTAWQESNGDLWRNSLLIALLLIPGVLVLIVGGYAFQMGALGIALPLAESVRSLQGMLAGFVTVISLAMFVTIVLLTVGAMAIYGTK